MTDVTHIPAKTNSFTHYAYLAGHDLDGNDVYVIDIVGEDGKTLSGVWCGETEAEMRQAAKLWIFDGCTVHFREPPEWMVQH